MADTVLANDGDRAGRRLRKFMCVVCNEHNSIEHIEHVVIAISHFVSSLF